MAIDPVSTDDRVNWDRPTTRQIIIRGCPDPSAGSSADCDHGFIVGVVGGDLVGGRIAGPAMVEWTDWFAVSPTNALDEDADGFLPRRQSSPRRRERLERRDHGTSTKVRSGAYRGSTRLRIIALSSPEPAGSNRKQPRHGSSNTSKPRSRRASNGREVRGVPGQAGRNARLELIRAVKEKQRQATCVVGAP